jgi:ribosomal protein S18 acetylase RimI-like enzyme
LALTMTAAHNPTLAVTYLELRAAPQVPPGVAGNARVSPERLSRADYLSLYRRVGDSVRWDQRLQMSPHDLDSLLAGDGLRIYVMRDERSARIGLCELDRSRFPELELVNFGVVPERRGRGLGPQLLLAALRSEWQAGATRIFLHTDTWDHPAARALYEAAGFRVYAEREEPAGPL